MSPIRLAYMPLITYPDVVPDESVAAAVAFAGAIGCELQVTTLAVDIPPLSSPIAGLLIDLPEMARTVEERSRANCRRLQALVLEKAGDRTRVNCATKGVGPSLAGDEAASEARYFDLALLPWSGERPVVQDLAQAVVFGAGRPAILVPPSAISRPIEHLAIAWDGSRVAARALADAMPLLAAGGRITILTVEDEKPLDGPGIAEALASTLKKGGHTVAVRMVALDGREIASALQEAALDAGANLLAMGGFGHSRIRDFILGGATKGVLGDLRLPVLLSH